MRFCTGKYTQKWERGTDCFEKKSDRRKRRGVGERGARPKAGTVNAVGGLERRREHGKQAAAAIDFSRGV